VTYEVKEEKTTRLRRRLRLDKWPAFAKASADAKALAWQDGLAGEWSAIRL